MTFTLHLADRKARGRDPELTAELRLKFGPSSQTGYWVAKDTRRHYRKLRKRYGLSAMEARDVIWQSMFAAHLADTKYWVKEYELCPS
jgi:hypothetical protein